LIISGEALIYIFKYKILSEKFFKLGLMCRSVICCRVSPKQKSQVVRLVMGMGNWTTLAVGDGTNDVPMIMEANIGVGIQGVEGTQAVRSSDYGICQFKYLQRLILVHGRNGYRRISNFICYYFYKNIILVFAEIYFVYFSGFSGQPFFPDFLPILYNSVWTSWPCIFAYAIESDLVDKTFEKACKNKLKDKNNLLGKNFEIIPKLYQAGHLKYYFNLKIFWLWLLYAIIHGGLSYAFISIGIRNSSVASDGKLVGHWWTNTLIFSCIIHIVTYKIFIEITYWNWLVIATSVLSILLYYLSIILINTRIFSRKLQNELAGKVYDMLLCKTFWLYVFTLPLLVMLFDWFLKNIYRFLKPSPTDLVNLNKIKVQDKENIVKKMTILKENNEVFNKKNIFNHFLLKKHNQKNSIIELPRKNEIKIENSYIYNDNPEKIDEIRDEFNNTCNENLLSPSTNNDFEINLKNEKKSKLLKGEI